MPHVYDDFSAIASRIPDTVAVEFCHRHGVDRDHLRRTRRLGRARRRHAGRTRRRCGRPLRDSRRESPPLVRRLPGHSPPRRGGGPARHGVQRAAGPHGAPGQRGEGAGRRRRGTSRRLARRRRRWRLLPPSCCCRAPPPAIRELVPASTAGAAPPRPARLPGHRGRPGGDALHLRHHQRSERRGADARQPPRRDGRVRSGSSASTSGTRSSPSCRCSTRWRRSPTCCSR